MVRIERANAKYKDSFLNAVRLMQGVINPPNSSTWYKDLDIKYLQNHFNEYLEQIHNREIGIGLKEGYSTETFFWIIDDKDNFVGRISLRHKLMPALEIIGGHIGYDIINTEQRKGYATEALRLAILEAEKIGIEKLLITCDEDNIASKKTIEKNGGELIEKLHADKDDKVHLRYWITTKAKDKKMVRIERANAKFKNSFINAVKEMQKSEDINTNSSCSWYKDLDVNYLDKNFDAYVAKILSREKGDGLPEGWVPDTFYWIINENDEYVGRVSLRHHLTPALELLGGHIGYDVIPSQRRKGYISEALRQTLLEAKKMGITKALMTCHESNIASKKAIEKNGGKEWDRIPAQGEEGIDIRFWIEL